MKHNSTFINSHLIFILLITLSMMIGKTKPAWADETIPTEPTLIFETRTEFFHIQIQKVIEHVQNLSSLVERLNPFKFDEMSEKIQLLNFSFFTEKASQVEAYKRTRHFGGWAKNKKSGNCYNTRAKVLIRDNIGVLKFKDENPCSVVEGQWNDPYGGEIFTDAQAIQIDHMVPLKEAYVSGGYKWNFKERCLYGNYLGYNHHLIAVDGEENNEKSDQTPIDYMPSRKEYQCEYLKDWLTIKALWGLSFTTEEQAHITQLINLNNCDKSQFYLTTAELKKQQKFFRENLELCAGIEKQIIKDEEKKSLKKQILPSQTIQKN